MNKQNKDLNKLLESINKCCIEIAKRDNLDVKFKKLEFLEKEGFYNNYPANLFTD
jgi:hypothetical protein